MHPYGEKFPELEEVIEKMERVRNEVGLIRKHLESGLNTTDVSANPVPILNVEFLMIQFDIFDFSVILQFNFLSIS